MGKEQRKRKGHSIQDLIGIKAFTKYGLSVGRYELLFYSVAPTNISVLSRANIEIKIHKLMMVLSAIPDIIITCTDSAEQFDDNKNYMTERLSKERNSKVQKVINNIQMEMATARQFLFTACIKGNKDKRTFDTANRIEKTISEQGFEVHRLAKEEIKRFLALYFDASMSGELMPDIDGSQFFAENDETEN